MKSGALAVAKMPFPVVDRIETPFETVQNRKPGMSLLSQSRRLGTVLAVLVFAAVASGGALANPKIAVDVASGRVIEHEQAFQRWYPASLTKLMTIYVVFKAVKSGQLTMQTPRRRWKRLNWRESRRFFWPTRSRSTC